LSALKRTKINNVLKLLNLNDEQTSKDSTENL